MIATLPLYCSACVHVMADQLWIEFFLIFNFFSFLACWSVPAKYLVLIRNWTIKQVVFLAQLRSCLCSFAPRHETWCFDTSPDIETSCWGVLKACKAVVVTAVPKRGGFGPAFPIYCCWCSSNLFLNCPNSLTWHKALQVLVGWFSPVAVMR